MLGWFKVQILILILASSLGWSVHLYNSMKVVNVSSNPQLHLEKSRAPNIRSKVKIELISNKMLIPRGR